MQAPNSTPGRWPVGVPRTTRHWDATPKFTTSVTREPREDRTSDGQGMGCTSDVSRVYGPAEYLSPVALSLLFSPYQPGAAVAMTCKCKEDNQM